MLADVLAAENHMMSTKNENDLENQVGIEPDVTECHDNICDTMPIIMKDSLLIWRAEAFLVHSRLKAPVSVRCEAVTTMTTSKLRDHLMQQHHCLMKRQNLYLQYESTKMRKTRGCIQRLVQDRLEQE
jgi:hypothetical protein